MENGNNILLYQMEDNKTKIHIILENKNVWMTQKSIAILFKKSVNTVNEHIKNILMNLDERKCSKYFNITNTEGSRRVKRELFCYNFDVVFNIAIRCQCFDEFNRFVGFVKRKGVNKDFLPIIPIKERIFADLVLGALEGIVDVLLQYKIDNYIVDFYIPEANLIVEYDEKYHLKQVKEDKERQKNIEEKLKVKFIRVSEGEELKGLNCIIKYLFINKTIKNVEEV